MQNNENDWSKAFFRFNADEQQMGSTCSYMYGDEVQLIGTLKAKEFFLSMNNLFSDLRESTNIDDKKFCVALLVVNNDFDYDIKFEYSDPTKWEISKIDGATGIPVDYNA